MNCSEVEELLYTEPVGAFAGLEPHLSSCAGCSALAGRIRAGEQELDELVEGFVAGGDLGAALARARANPARPERHLGQWAAVAAAAVVLLGTVWGAQERAQPAFGPECADRSTLEEPAIQGALALAQLRCLQRGLQTTDDVRAKDEASRLLLVNHWVNEPSGPEWEAQLRWHLAQDLPPDPELTYKAALHFRKQGEAADAIDAVERTRAHMDAWSEDLRAQREANLLAVEASARFTQLQDRPQDETLRAVAIEAARAWSSVRPDGAKGLCNALTGSEDCQP